MKRILLAGIFALFAPFFSFAAACVDISRILSLNSKGTDVSALQEFLRDNAGYTGAITGNFGPLTRAGVGNWQLQKGIVANTSTAGYGQVGPKTRAAMRCSAVSSTTSPSTSSGQSLEALKAEVIRLVGVLNSLLTARGLPPVSLPSFATTLRPPPTTSAGGGGGGGGSPATGSGSSSGRGGNTSPAPSPTLSPGPSPSPAPSPTPAPTPSPSPSPSPDPTPAPTPPPIPNPIPPPPPPSPTPRPPPTPTPTPTPQNNQFTGSYFNNRTLSGTPVLTRSDANVNFYWETASPGAGVLADNFSARWEGNWNFPRSGTYRFYATTDDGIRVWVDGELIMGPWKDQALTTYAIDKSLSAGLHAIKVEYYDSGGPATAIMSWAQVPNALIAEEKRAGCTADGILWAGSDEIFRGGLMAFDDFLQLIARSNCKLLHRSIEAWFSPPDFTKVQQRMNQLQSLSGGKQFIYSLNIAEAILPEVNSYYDPLSGRNLDFNAMCVPGENQRGEYYGLGCVPSYRNSEFRLYLTSIMRRSVDLGVQDFMFGEMVLPETRRLVRQNGSLVAPGHRPSDDSWYSDPIFPQIFAELRAYAFSKGRPITIGCQIGDARVQNAPWSHLRLCDYKYSPLWTTGSNEWANANITSLTHVLADFEWWGQGDDVDVFAKKTKQDRDSTAWNNFWYMRSIAGQGLLLPFAQPLPDYPGSGHCPHPENNGSVFFSPSRTYCDNEDAMNAALAGKKVFITSELDTVPHGGSAKLWWLSWGASSCVVKSSGYTLLSGLNTSGTYGPLNHDHIFTLECRMDDGTTQTAETTVRVTGSSASAAPSTPTTMQLASTLTALESALAALLGILGR